MSAFDIALRLAGVPDETIVKIEAAAPATAALLRLIKENEALILDARDLAARAQPVIKQAVAEIEILLPATEDIAVFLQKQNPAPDLPLADHLGAENA